MSLRDLVVHELALFFESYVELVGEFLHLDGELVLEAFEGVVHFLAFVYCVLFVVFYTPIININ